MTAIAIVGLGYVGLPLATAFGRLRNTIGFDLDEAKITQYRNGHDPSGEVSAQAMALATGLEFTSDPKQLSTAQTIIVVVPTPIDSARQPDLGPLKSACKVVGQHMQAGATVVFESTVYPGCTEEDCIPWLEQYSGMSWAGRADAGSDNSFHVGYSPERINPGDKEHRLETITKVVAGDSAATTEQLAELYGQVVTAGIHRAPSIKVAEAAKVIENTQRDLNIALMNELAVIFNRLDIDTMDVLEAAGTKWNFLPFRPGLVGGHCIGVDPYYLTHRAEAAGYHPQVILAGRQINDTMGKFVAEQTIKHMAKNQPLGSRPRITVLGLSFKENCPDIRNSQVASIVRELEEYHCQVQIHDPLAQAEDAMQEYGLQLTAWDELESADALVLAVPHAAYLALQAADIHRLLNKPGCIIDVKSVLDPQDFEQSDIKLWRL